MGRSKDEVEVEPKAKTFAEQKGTPVNEALKEQGKKKAALQKQKNRDESSGLHGLNDKVPDHIFYFQRGQKINKCIVTPMGNHTVYVGTLDSFNKQKHSALLKPLVEKWKSEKKFIEGEGNVKIEADRIRKEVLPGIVSKAADAKAAKKKKA